MDAETKERLEQLEEKIDACLVLLRMATSHDVFRYTLSDKSPLWTRAMRGAEVIVSRVIDRVALVHREYEKALQSGEVRLSCPRSPSPPSQPSFSNETQASS
jgi:hypothetical protein